MGELALILKGTTEETGRSFLKTISLEAEVVVVDT
jgi:hypothetical protein